MSSVLSTRDYCKDLKPLKNNTAFLKEFLDYIDRKTPNNPMCESHTPTTKQSFSYSILMIIVKVKMFLSYNQFNNHIYIYCIYYQLITRLEHIYININKSLSSKFSLSFAYFHFGLIQLSLD